MYELVWKKAAQKGLRKMPGKMRKALIDAMEKIAENPNRHDFDIKPLVGYSGFFRLRIGSYRAVYACEEQIRLIVVEKAGPRGDIYKN